ncbi:Signal transduction histidine kinase [Nocardioides terrae]|uniref:histidine kinase n=1 Tax=Nocardioides terrae TaxID=574651 RepID=A0A1I1NU19_9ACTN|nr:sensor histidine kinase [Nocardioides terrae]SFD00925.1 Signal transduction histidine kinase [Nocardioides terrae]
MSSFPDAWTAVRGRPWRFLASAWPWRSVLYVASTVPVGIVVLVVLVTVVGVGLLTAVVIVGVLALLRVPLITRVVAAVERWRLRLVQPQPAGRRTSWREQLRAWRSLPVAWSEIGYAVLLSTVLLAVDGLALAVLSAPVVLIASPLFWQVTPGEMEVAGWRVDTVGEAWLAVPVGAVLLLVLAYLLTWLACGQAALARLLLDPPEERLQQAVAELRRSRSGLVDAFAAERHRIERDLHDGVQQRLVALTMTLGSAELEVEDGPGLELVRAAHRQAEDALADLRATVRGIHPQVLTDHGLVAAVHEIADRFPVPVGVDLALPERLPAPVENAAYFVVSESLTNVARHARAGRADVRAWVEQTGGVLVLTVTDDGVGGADAAQGSGLAGLAARVEALDGTLLVTSPVGGPTQVRVECPLR